MDEYGWNNGVADYPTLFSGIDMAYYVDSIGFKDVSHLLPELHEVEAQRQKEQVQDEPER